MRDTTKNHHQRLNDLETQIELIKKMNKPAGDDGSSGLLDLIQDMQDKLRGEFDSKLENLKRELMMEIDELKKKDADQQVEIDNLKTLFDNHEKRLEDLLVDINQVKEHKVDQDDYDKQIAEMMQMIQALSSGKPVEVRAPTPKGPKITEEDVAKWNQAA